jgi:hypothetical protein
MGSPNFHSGKRILALALPLITSNVSIITGEPGVGKTSSLDALVRRARTVAVTTAPCIVILVRSPLC